MGDVILVEGLSKFVKIIYANKVQKNLCKTTSL